MCEATHVSPRAGATIPRPRWGLLYGVTFLGLVALAFSDVAAPSRVRPTLDGAVAGGALLAVALWVRGNRTALDLDDWCECAGDKVTVRVIASRRPEPSAPSPDVLEDVWLAQPVGRRRSDRAMRGLRVRPWTVTEKITTR